MSTRKRTTKRAEPTPIVPLTDKFVREEITPLLDKGKGDSNLFSGFFGPGGSIKGKKTYDDGVEEGFMLGFNKGFKRALIELANAPKDTPLIEWENRVLVVEGGQGTQLSEGEVRRFPIMGTLFDGKVVVFDGDETLAATYGPPKQIPGKGLLKPDLKLYIDPTIEQLRQAGIIAPKKA
ncbi:MAG: hypothetical protein ABSF36_09040 [Candidatus Methanomethylicaceae archaeon]